MSLTWAQVKRRIRERTAKVVKHRLFPQATQQFVERAALRRRRKEGPPQDVPVEALNDMCWNQWNISPQSMWHAPIHSWKAASAYFVWLDLGGGRVERVVLKTAPATPRQYLEAARFPVTPGPPEFWIYNTAAPILSRHLAECLLATRLEERGTFLYVLEDLTTDHRKPPEVVGWRPGASHLEDLHAALTAAAERYGDHALIKYDRTFSESLLSHGEESLRRLHEITRNASALAVLDDWTTVSDLYMSSEFDLPELHTCVHGDYNTGNVFVAKDDATRVKVVDWEWAGLGLPHMDLASYLRSAPTDVVKAVLSAHSQRHDSIPASLHGRLFWRCALERSIWDASLFSDHVEYEPSRYGRLESAIDRSVSRALIAIDQLRR